MPADRPLGYELAPNDVAWNSRYLELKAPAGVHTLEELGDKQSDLALSSVALTEPFRILSDEGVALAQAICQELEGEAKGDARSKRLRGCTYRSEFLAGMYADRELLGFLRELSMAPLRVHPIGHHRVQLNFAPEILTKDVDVWHNDVVAYDFVMMVTDPAGMVGGKTEYFLGSVEEGLALLAATKALPPERVRAVDYPGPGWAIFQQGHRVLHRAARLEQPHPRISLVASYYCADSEFREPTILPPLRKVDGREIALREWACYAATRTVARLEAFLEDQPDFAMPLDEILGRLRGCQSELAAAIAEFDSTDEGYLPGVIAE